jgi:hypothetical protein
MLLFFKQKKLATNRFSVFFYPELLVFSLAKPLYGRFGYGMKEIGVLMEYLAYP